DPARLRALDLPGERLREVALHVGERLLDELAIDLLRHFHVLVVGVGADAEADDLGEAEHVQAVDEQRVRDAEEELLGGGIRRHGGWVLTTLPRSVEALPKRR